MIHWTVSAIEKEFREKHKMQFNCCLRFSIHNFTVRSNSEKVINIITDYYKNFIVSPPEKSTIIDLAQNGIQFFDVEFKSKPLDFRKTEIKEEYFDMPDGRCVRKILTGMVFIFGEKTNLALGDCIKNSNQIINFINNRYIQKMLDEDCLLLHSSAVSFSDQGLAISGFSGSGKSTLALHLVSKGFDFISNDRVLCKVRNDKPVIYGVAKYPRINPGTIINNADLRRAFETDDFCLYEKMSKNILWQYEKKHDVVIENVFGNNRFKTDCRLKSLVILNWSCNSSEKTSITKIDIKKRKDLYPAFMKSPGLFYLEREKPSTDSSYLEILTRCNNFETTGKADFDIAADFFLNYIPSIL